MSRPSGTLWYVDIRDVISSEKLSLDLVRHLAQRLHVGPCVIIHPKPASILPALRKRWLHIQAELKRQSASTLNKHRRDAIDAELMSMQVTSFSLSIDHYSQVTILPADTDCACLAKFSTLYIASDITCDQARCVLACASQECAIVIYDAIFNTSEVLIPILEEYTQPK